MHKTTTWCLVTGMAGSLLWSAVAGAADTTEGLSMPAMIFISVDLPEPLTPTTPIFASGKKLSQMFSNTFLPPG